MEKDQIQADVIKTRNLVPELEKFVEQECKELLDLKQLFRASRDKDLAQQIDDKKAKKMEYDIKLENARQKLDHMQVFQAKLF